MAEKAQFSYDALSFAIICPR